MTITDIVNQIRNAIYGKDVRRNIADGIETVYNRQDLAIYTANEAKTTADNAYARTSQIIANNGNGTKDTELVDARKGKVSLRDKVDEIDSSIDNLNHQQNDIYSLFRRLLKTDPHFVMKNINVIGDSIAHGANVPDISNDSWTGILRKFLQLEYNTRNYGYVNMMATISNAKGTYQDMHEIETTGTWDANQDNNYLGLYRYLSSQNGSKLLIKPKYKTKKMRIHFEGRPDGGKFKVMSCGDTLVTVDTYWATYEKDFVSPIIDISKYPDNFIFEIEKMDNGIVAIQGVTYLDSPDEMVFNNYSRSGAGLGWMGNEILDISSKANTVFFALGHNDEWNNNISEFKINIDKCIGYFNVYNTFVVVLDFIWRQPKTNAHREELQRLAKETNGLYICFDELWGNDTAKMIEQGFLSDESHPTALGHQIIAEKIAKTLGLSVNSRALAEKLLESSNLPAIKNVVKNNDFEAGINVNWTFYETVAAGTVTLGQNLNASTKIGEITPYMRIAAGLGDIDTGAVLESAVINVIPHTTYRIKFKEQTWSARTCLKIYGMDSNVVIDYKYISDNPNDEALVDSVYWKDFDFEFDANNESRIVLQFIMLKGYASPNSPMFTVDDIICGYSLN